jgi:hypothetical protein
MNAQKACNGSAMFWVILVFVPLNPLPFLMTTRPPFSGQTLSVPKVCDIIISVKMQCERPFTSFTKFPSPTSVVRRTRRTSLQKNINPTRFSGLSATPSCLDARLGGVGPRALRIRGRAILVTLRRATTDRRSRLPVIDSRTVSLLAHSLFVITSGSWSATAGY